MIALLSVVDESGLYTGEGYHWRSQEREKLESLCTVNLTGVQSKMMGSVWSVVVKVKKTQAASKSVKAIIIEI